MPIDFYYALPSPPCRGPLLTARALGVPINLKFLNVFEGEQNKPEFLTINPQHCVPTIVDGDFKLWEGRAISAYLVNQYGKDDVLYPKCPKARAAVDRLMYFDMGTLFHRFGEYIFPAAFHGKPKDPEKLSKVHEALGWLNSFLEGNVYVTGQHITIADHTLISSVSSMVAAGVDISKHPNIVSWVSNCKVNMPGYDENEKGAQEFGAFINSKIN